MMHRRLILWATVIVAGLALVMAAPVAAQSKIVRVPSKVMVNLDGHALFDAYCLSCHGQDGKGNGPAAKAVSAPVPDLTLITVRDGQFVPVHVLAHITEVHTVAEMPYWPDVLRSSCGSEAKAHMAEANLARYIQSLQAANH